MTDLTVQQQISLQPYNTLAVPCTAQYFADAGSVDELQQALVFAQTNALNSLVIGEGSNLVLPDYFSGLAIKNSIKGIVLDHESDKDVCLTIGAGENWHQLVCYCLDAGYWGIENLSLIPGTVGAAPIQNIGAYGVELTSVFNQLTALNKVTGELTTFSHQDCEFGYRDSVFKNRLRNQLVITHVTLCLSKTPHINISYPALSQALRDCPESSLTPKKISEAVCQIRRSKLPDPATIPNAGSFFKNPVVAHKLFIQLQTQYPDIVAYPVADEGNKDSPQPAMKLAAGWLLENAGWKGVQEKGVGMHSKQALVLTNTGHEPGRKIIEFAANPTATCKRSPVPVW